MGVNKRKGGRGRSAWFVDRRWPDGTQLRRRVPNAVVGKKLLARVEEAIAMGTWRKLKEELCRDHDQQMTVAQLSERYLDYCRIKNRRPDFKELTLKSVTRLLGDVRVRDFRRSHAHEFISRRSREVADATVNRGVAVIKNMLTYALEQGIIEVSPLARFSMLPEPERKLRIMTIEEELQLADCVAEQDLVIGVYTAILGETGLRKEEGLNLKWEDLDFRKRLLTVGKSKSGRIRQVPLTTRALMWLDRLDRIVGVPWVFMRDRQRRWKDPRGPFKKGKLAAGLDWVKGFHDLRHFRATTWILLGMQVPMVQKLMGHSSITTTMRYVHLVAGDATEAVRRAEEREQQELSRDRAQSVSRV